MGLFSVAVCSMVEGEPPNVVWHSKVPVAGSDSRAVGREALRQASRGPDDTRRLRVYVVPWQALVLERVEKPGRPA